MTIKVREIVLALFLLGLGWVARSFVLHPVVPAASVFTALVTILVGWQIQSELKRQGELSKVPIDAVSVLCRRVDDLVAECLRVPAGSKTTEPQLLQSLRSLSNEVGWLCAIARNFKCDRSLSELAGNAFQDLYDALSIGPSIDSVAGEAAGRRLRARALAMQWSICESVLKDSHKPSELRTLLQKLER